MSDDVAALRAVAAGTRPAPEAMGPYLAKVRDRAYAVADADVEALMAAGLTEDEIFEQTVAAAMSTKPGATTCPVASMVSAASPPISGSLAPRRTTSTITPSLMPMSARKRSAPVPSTTVPPVIFRSNTRLSFSSPCAGEVRRGGISLREVA